MGSTARIASSGNPSSHCARARLELPCPAGQWPAAAPSRNRKFADSLLEGSGFELVHIASAMRRGRAGGNASPKLEHVEGADWVRGMSGRSRGVEVASASPAGASRIRTVGRPPELVPPARSKSRDRCHTFRNGSIPRRDHKFESALLQRESRANSTLFKHYPGCLLAELLDITPLDVVVLRPDRPRLAPLAIGPEGDVALEVWNGCECMYSASFHYRES
jgi:hypothetical protein